MTAGTVKVKQRKVLLYTVMLIVVCNIAVWAIMQRRYLNSVQSLITEKN